MKKHYLTDFYSYHRLATKKVVIGNINIGGGHRVAVQSMTNTNTLDTQATVQQCVALAKAGAEMIRIAAPGIAEAENLQQIKKEFKAMGYTTPLVADIHFNPKAAEIAAKYVEKVRINPGNYAENNQQSEFSNAEYQLALDKIAQKLTPLIKVCKKHKTVIRIGVNHGSLSNRILSRYGNTPEGMVEAALEFVQLFEKQGFFNLVISLKASDVPTMVFANRLLVSRMLESKNVYPIHLGITEAGNGMDGRQKSIAGIAALLQDGIGDTIRISLTEDPVKEIPLALQLRNSDFSNQQEIQTEALWFNPFTYHKRTSEAIAGVGGKNKAVVILPAAQRNNCQVGKPFLGVETPPADFMYVGKEKPVFWQENTKYIQDYEVWDGSNPNDFPLLGKADLLNSTLPKDQKLFVRLNFQELKQPEVYLRLQQFSSAVLILTSVYKQAIYEWRLAFSFLEKEQMKLPVILHSVIEFPENERFLLEATRIFSPLLLDGLGDGLWIEENACVHLETLKQVSFGILQSCRLRQTKTEYIACPSCGRTLFNIEARLEQIKKKTQRFTHLKIAVMGCVVNGPGEMADADYGYVGSGAGKVHVYKGKTCVLKNVPEEKAADELLALIVSEEERLVTVSE